MEFLEVLKVILLGIIEGITEWLPISSTGHMILFDEFLPLNLRDEFKEMFFVVIQLGAILAVVVMFWKRLFPLRVEVREGGESGNETMKKVVADKGILTLWGKVLVACIPAGVIGVLFDDWLEAHLHTPVVIALMLILYGVAFLWVEKRNENKTFPIQKTDDITFKHALLIGAFQVLSLIPGTSRSGATILGALLIGVSRPVGAEFTFFLAVPVMVGASGIKLLKFFLESGGFSGGEFGYLFIGAAVAFVVSLLIIRFLMDFVKKHDFTVFGWYRILLGAAVLGILVIPEFF